MDKVQLKASSILNVPLQAYPNDFTFVVNGQEYQTNRLISDLISTKISNIHLNDPTFDRFTINTQNKGNFLQILRLVDFNEISISNNEAEFLLEVIEQLGNEHLMIIESDESVELTLDNIFTQIKKHSKQKTILKKCYGKEIDFISSHFSEILSTHKEEMFKLDEETLNKIITNPKLELEDEDELLNFLNEIYKLNSKISQLYSNVIFQNVTSKSMTEFINIFDYNDIDYSIWSSISERLKSEIQKVNSKSERTYKQKKRMIKSFVHKQNDDFNGIIKFLTDKTGGNIHDNGTIEISSNSFQQSHHFKNLVDFKNDNFYFVENKEQHAWVCFDFKESEIEVSSYSIKSSCNSSNGNHIKNWVIEVSQDGKDWLKIDERTNYPGLNGSYITKTFDVSKKCFSRFCRFRHTGEYWGTGNFGFHSIEFYGRLREPLI